MDTLHISELAERAGFPATTLRYYETLGLLGPVAREANGYRVYADETVARLRFIDRAKRLGVPLDEVAELVPVWASGDCPPVRERLHDLVRSKAIEVQAQLAELSSFAADLDRARANLVGATAATCGPDCGCTPPAEAAHTCALTPDRLTDRKRRWSRLLSRATARSDDPSGVRLVFPAETAISTELVTLIGAERSCCTFLGFTLGWAGTDLVLHVTAPPDGWDLMDDLLAGVPAGQ